MRILTIASQEIARLVSRMTRFLASGNFAAFALCALVFYQVFIALMAFAPPSGGAWGGFVEDFRVRCFSFNPETGWSKLSSVWVMLLEPLPLEILFLIIWRAPLRELWSKRRSALVPIAGSALMLIALIAVSLAELGNSQATPAELPFPGDRLRTALPMPAFTLTNQANQAVSLADFRGRVALVTAIYSTCTKTCPMMLSKIRGVLDQLTPEQRNQLVVVAFSLNPEADTRELREMIARAYGLKAEFHFVNGLPAEVNAVLDQLNVARVKDEKTGQISHSNLFYLLDRSGAIAYRLSFSENEQTWLISALRVLLSEKS